MSARSKFGNLKSATSSAPSAVPQLGAGEGGKGPASRQGRKQIAGFFSPEMSFSLHMLARRQGRNLQGLMTEAFDDVLRKYGESPVGE
jgi:hypothetical protein